MKVSKYTTVAKRAVAAALLLALANCSGGTLKSLFNSSGPATLVSVEVTPTNPSKAAGTYQQFVATGVYSDSSTKDISTSATWTSSNATVATVGSATGLAYGVATGSTTITATLNGISGSTTYTITNATLVSIAVTAATTVPAMTIPAGNTLQFTATGTYSDSTTQDLTSTATWTSNATAVATIDISGLATGTSAGTTTITASCTSTACAGWLSGVISNTQTLTVTAATLVSIAVTPTNPSQAAGLTQQFTATGTYTDNSTQNLTTTVTWSSGTPATATVSNAGGSQGLATGLAAGSSVITATSGAISGNTAFTVTAATLVSIAVTPTNPSKAAGLTQQFTATGTYSDSTTQNITTSVAWSSGTPAIATVSNAGGSQGLATGLTAGTSVITATSGAISGNTNFTVTAATLVSIAVTPATPSKAAGLTQQFTATGTYTDNSTQNLTTSVTWSSGTTATATISNAGGSQGLASALAAGTTTIAATSGVISGNTIFTVTAATLVSIAVTPTTPSQAAGLTEQFTATGTYTDSSTQNLTTTVTWSSGTTATATISNAGGSQGLASALAAGTTTITATSGAISGNTTFTVTVATLVSIAVTPANSSQAAGLAQQFTATGTYTDNSTQNLTTTATWSSGTTATATISNAGGSQGLASALATGSTIITATLGAVSGNTNFNVTAATLVSISVTPASSSVAAGLTQQFTATGTYTDNSTQNLTTTVTWSSGTTATATISNAGGSQGLASAVAAGTTTITATSGAISGNTTLTVTAATLVSIAISPTNPSKAKGVTQQFTATGTYTDNSTQNLTALATWSSDSTFVAPISNAGGSQGLATALNTGTANISASCPSGSCGNTSGGAITSPSTSFTVTNATLVSIVLAPVNPSSPVGINRQFTATGIYSDSSVATLTTSVTWTSSSTGVATISNAGGSQGLATPASTGSTTITATLGAISGNTTLTVTSATLVAITVTPATPTIAKGTSEQFVATGVFSDSSTQDISTQVTWASGTTATATISNASGSQGLATSVASGTSIISATLSGKTGSTTLTVSSATLVSIAITPITGTVIGLGTTQQYTATGTYSDSSTQNLTTLVTWSSSVPGFATISNASGTQGLTTSVAAGTTTVIATCPNLSCGNVSGSSISGTATLQVKLITLVSIAVTPANPSVTTSTTQQMYATGTYNDSSQQDLTTQVTWTSSNAAVATIVTGTGGGVATAIGTNGQTATLTATYNGISGSTVLTVISDTTPPTLLSASLSNTAQILVTYSEAVNVTQASTAANYLVATAPGGGSCAGGNDFSGSTQTADFTISSITVVSTTQYIINISAGIQGSTYSVIVNNSNVQDLAGNTMSCPNSTNFVGVNSVPPTVLSAVSFTGTDIRVTFSKTVNTVEATTASAYKVVTTMGGTCGAGTNFASSTQTSDFSIVSVSGSGAVYDITTSATQVSGTSYTVIVNNTVYDVGTPALALSCANYATFTGLAQLLLSSAVCVDTTHVIATFSKNILTGLNASSSGECTDPTDCANRYQFTGATSLGNINSAYKLDGTICGGAAASTSQVCITTATAQGGGQYTLTVANGISGDGFDNAWGSIENAAGTENVQAAPNDRRTFTGCATSPQNFSDGPIAQNPFNDSSTFGNVMSYNSKIYIGPNTAGNAANRFNPDGSTPESLTFSFVKDTTQQTGGTKMSNPATSRDGGTAVPPYVTLGHSGCTATGATTAANLATGCGPDLENLRGLFADSTLNGTDYLIIGGGKSGGAFSYIYYTGDTDTQLDFNYIDLSAISGTNTQTFSSMAVMDSRIYVGYSRQPTNRPDFGVISFNTADGTNKYCVAGSNCDIISGNQGVRLNAEQMPYLGAVSTTYNPTTAINWSYYAGVDAQIVFNEFLYIAGGGYPKTGHDGAIVRSNNSNPGACGTTSGACAWTEISPRTNSAWNGTNGWYSLELATVSGLIPANKAFPAFAIYNNNLFVIRNTCTTTGTATSSQTTATTIYPGCNDGTVTKMQPQLWMCNPASTGAATSCEAADWVPVAQTSSTTNFGDSTNKAITMLVTNGSYLYVGFDNATTGAQVWRTNVTTPANASDFSQIGTSGFGSASTIQQIFSYVSLPQSGSYYLYVATGNSGTPVSVYRQLNN